MPILAIGLTTRASNQLRRLSVGMVGLRSYSRIVLSMLIIFKLYLLKCDDRLFASWRPHCRPHQTHFKGDEECDCGDPLMCSASR